MNEILARIKRQAAALSADMPRPAFYERCTRELRHSHGNFFDHPLVLRLREDVLPFLLDTFGHGVEHAKTVAIEAGAIVLVEEGDADLSRARHLALLAQLAGLLHDTRRLEDEHAQKGEELTHIILQDYPLSEADKQVVAFAVGNHEAFREPQAAPDQDAALVSGALYDADKFRWGPDNFITTLWEMCDYLELSLAEITQSFPSGVEKIGEIAGTFRTATGRAFGPEFIDIGLALGREVYELLRQAAASERA